MIMTFELILHYLVEATIPVFELIGVGIIIASGIRGFYSYVSRKPDTKLTLAKGLAMGLEFKLGSEILRTVIVRDCYGGRYYCAEGGSYLPDSLGD